MYFVIQYGRNGVGSTYGLRPSSWANHFELIGLALLLVSIRHALVDMVFLRERSPELGRVAALGVELGEHVFGLVDLTLWVNVEREQKVARIQREAYY